MHRSDTFTLATCVSSLIVQSLVIALYFIKPGVPYTGFLEIAFVQKVNMHVCLYVYPKAME